MTALFSNLRMFIWMTALTGLAYPLFITAIAQLTMPIKASGELVEEMGQWIGARLIAQSFTKDSYFWPRPSSVSYNPLPSGGSNLGPTSASLKKAIDERQKKIGAPLADIPSELLYASGSGLDPHISPAAAHFQIERILKARGLDPQAGLKTLHELIALHTDSSLLGPPCVNVLLLNRDLDKLTPPGKAP